MVVREPVGNLSETDVYNVLLGEARKLLGDENVLGEESLTRLAGNIESLYGTKVRFVTDTLSPLPTRADLELAKKRGELLVLVPNSIVFERDPLPKQLELNCQALISLFPSDKRPAVFDQLARSLAWSEAFARGYPDKPELPRPADAPDEIKPGWILAGPISKSPDYLDEINARLKADWKDEEGARKTTVTEEVYVKILQALSGGEVKTNEHRVVVCDDAMVSTSTPLLHPSSTGPDNYIVSFLPDQGIRIHDPRGPLFVSGGVKTRTVRHSS